MLRVSSAPAATLNSKTAPFPLDRVMLVKMHWTAVLEADLSFCIANLSVVATMWRRGEAERVRLVNWTQDSLSFPAVDRMSEEDS